VIPTLGVVWACWHLVIAAFAPPEVGVTEEAVCAAAEAGEKRRFIVEGPHEPPEHRGRILVAEEGPPTKSSWENQGLTIRALQGHSVAVELPLVATQPPDRLFHGTVARFLAAILHQGLVRGERRHVHLSAREEDARVVGARRSSARTGRWCSA
jgi:RNA:NAD 2'-phosphotransferase (TPT1/KptA family)